MDKFLSDPKYKWGAIIFVGLVVGLYLISATSYISKCSATRKSCLEHRIAGCNITGEYNVLVGDTRSEVTCDMDTEGGGWTLAANYLHKKGTPAKPLVMTKGHFPIQNKSSLGYDETDNPSSWGHASTATLSAVPFKEFRFFCQSSNHKRNVDFTIGSERCSQYLKTGQGFCIDKPDDRKLLIVNSRGLERNESKLPAVADKGWRNQGEGALTNYPFYTDFRHHWAVGALPNRFECDDYEPGGTTSTFHQVWIR